MGGVGPEMGAAHSAGLNVNSWIERHGPADLSRSPSGNVVLAVFYQAPLCGAPSFPPSPLLLMGGMFSWEYALIYFCSSLTGRGIRHFLIVVG